MSAIAIPMGLYSPTASSVYVRADSRARGNDARLASGNTTAEWLAVDKQLSVWLADPEAVVDAGAIAPTKDSIRRARACVAAIMRNGNALPPAAVVPDSNGGVTFEWDGSQTSTWLEIRQDSDEMIWLRRGYVVRRKVIPDPSSIETLLPIF